MGHVAWELESLQTSISPRKEQALFLGMKKAPGGGNECPVSKGCTSTTQGYKEAAA